MVLFNITFQVDLNFHYCLTLQVAVDSCLRDLEAYKDGSQLFPTHLENVSKDITVDENGQKSFKGHFLTIKQTNLEAVKNQFIHSLLSNIKKRLVDTEFILQGSI